jgi:hypothetical protein
MNELERLEALSAGATKPPWTCTEYETVHGPDDLLIDWPDSQFIAAARNALPDLLAVAQAADRVLKGGARMPPSDPPLLPDELSDLREALAPLLREAE